MKKLSCALIFTCFIAHASDELVFHQTKSFPAFVKEDSRFKSCFSSGEFAHELSAEEVSEESDELGLNSYCCLEGLAKTKDRFSKIEEGIRFTVNSSAWTVKNTTAFVFFNKESRHLVAHEKDIRSFSDQESSWIKSFRCSPGALESKNFGLKEVASQLGEYFKVVETPSRKTASSKK